MNNAVRFLCLCVGMTVALKAHETSTHVVIGKAAVAYLNAVYQGVTPSRPTLLGSVASLNQALQIGAVNEDNDPPLGRYLFHFTPFLDFVQQGYHVISANGCSSENWGQSATVDTTGGSVANGASGCDTSCALPPSGVLPLSLTVGFAAFCAVASGTHYNSYRWDQDLTPDTEGSATRGAVTAFGYVIHLLEDLGSPAHSRNDAHPCFNGYYCDEFEKFNDYSKYCPYGDPQNIGSVCGQPPGNVWAGFVNSTISSVPGVFTQVIPTTGFNTPTDFFKALQGYVVSNYYSNRTAFQQEVFFPTGGAVTGPTALFSDDNYFYGDCIIANGVAISQIAGTCNSVLNPVNGQMYMARKIAHKGHPWWYSCQPAQSGVGCDNTKADINQIIAREQFAELGPVIAQHVAAFIQFYAPALSVTVQGTGTVTSSSPGTGINCTSGATSGCSALFVQTDQGAPQITLAAGPGVTWGGDCSSAGTSATATVTLTGDLNCTASFAPTCPAQTVCGIVTDLETGSVSLPGVPIELHAANGAFLQTKNTDSSGKYSFTSLTAPKYFVDPVANIGEFSSPSQQAVVPGSVMANFKIGGVPELVTVTGPDTTFVLITTIPWTQPNAPPSNSPFFVASSAIHSGTTLDLANTGGIAKYWLTCDVFQSTPPSGFKGFGTSIQLPGLKANGSITVPCPP